MSRTLLFSLGLVAGLTPAVRANDITHIVTSSSMAVGGSTTVNVPQFDGSLGVLRLVHVTVLGQVSGTWGVENTAATPWGVGGYASGQYVTGHIPVTVPATMMSPPNPAFLPDPAVPLAPFDGAIDFAGASGHTFTFTNETGDGGPSQYADIYSDAGLSTYVGTGTMQIGLGPLGQSGPNGPPNFVHSVTLSATAIVAVRYTFEPFPARICRALSGSGCPCGNASSTANGGCANSAGTQGGVLDATGTASLSADTLTLTGSGMTNSSALYFQGTSFGYAQSVYGDGLRCVTGSVARLGTKFNAAGTSQYPVAGDPSVSVRGAVTQPGPRYYQVVYRDGGNFCTPSLFNATSGMAVLWTP